MCLSSRLMREQLLSHIECIHQCSSLFIFKVVALCVDPFDETDRYFPPGVNLHVYEEGRKETVGGVKEFWNRDKIMQTYGKFVMDYLKDKPILCSGVSVRQLRTLR